MSELVKEKIEYVGVEWWCDIIGSWMETEMEFTNPNAAYKWIQETARPRDKNQFGIDQNVRYRIVETKITEV